MGHWRLDRTWTLRGQRSEPKEYPPLAIKGTAPQVGFHWDQWPNLIMFPSSHGRDRQLPTGFKVSRCRAAGLPGQIWIAATQRSSQPAAKHVRLFLQWARCSLKLPLEKEEQQGKDTLHLKPKPTVWGRQVLWPSSPAWWLRESGEALLTSSLADSGFLRVPLREESFRGSARTEAWRNEAIHWMPTLTYGLVVMK